MLGWSAFLPVDPPDDPVKLATSVEDIVVYARGATGEEGVALLDALLGPNFRGQFVVLTGVFQLLEKGVRKVSPTERRDPLDLMG